MHGLGIDDERLGALLEGGAGGRLTRTDGGGREAHRYRNLPTVQAKGNHVLAHVVVVGSTFSAFVGGGTSLSHF